MLMGMNYGTQMQGFEQDASKLGCFKFEVHTGWFGTPKHVVVACRLCMLGEL